VTSRTGLWVLQGEMATYVMRSECQRERKVCQAKQRALRVTRVEDGAREGRGCKGPGGKWGSISLKCAMTN